MRKPTTKIWLKLTGPSRKYQYSPLSAKQIRILKLCPGQFNKPLVITLQEYDINAIEDMYEALSYAWDDPTRNIEIECNGGVLKITASLEIALRRLRLPNKRRVLWIDAICINQDDPEERAHQVPFMREIYPKAATVVIWLGEANNETELALTVIDNWADFNRKYRDNTDATRYAKFEEQFAFKPGYRDSLEAIGALTHRSWFNRCWTFQEILLSTRAELCIGKWRLTWDSFHFALVAFPVHLLVDEVLNFNALFMCYGKTKMENSTLTRTTFSISRNLSRLLQITRSFIASDPRDKIYSMLSMATLNDPSAFKPQYNMSVRNTFVSFTLAMIRDENSLNVLMSTGEPLRDKSLPSWCPDWTCNRSVTLIGYYDYIYYAVNGNFYPEFKNLQMNARYELALDGAVIDTVQEVFDLEALEEELQAITKDKDSYNFTPILTKFARKFGLHKRRLRQEISPEAALLRTLSADHWFFGAHVQSSYKELWFPTHLRFWDLKRNKKSGIAKYLDDFTNITTMKSADPRDPQTDFFCSQNQNGNSRNIKNMESMESPFTHSVIDKVYRQTSPYYIEGQDFEDAKNVDMHTLMAISKEAISQALFFFKGKKIILTQRGYVALGTAETRVGDTLCSFWGADVPFIIRKKSRAADGPWQIICECYIDGLMYGEISRDPTSKKKSQEHASATPPLVDWVKVTRFVVS